MEGRLPAHAMWLDSKNMGQVKSKKHSLLLKRYASTRCQGVDRSTFCRSHSRIEAVRGQPCPQPRMVSTLV